MLRSEKYDLDSIFRLFVSLVILTLFFFLVFYLRTILIPFAIAFLIANILDPAVDFFEGYKIPRMLSVIIVFSLIAGTLFLMFFIGIPYVINDLNQFSAVFPNYISNIYQYISNNVSESLQQNYREYIDVLIANLQTSQFFDTVLSYLTDLFSQLLNLIYLLIGAVIIVMYVFFLLRDIDKMRSKWFYYVPENYREPVRMFVKDAYDYTVNFFRGQLTVVTILGVLFAAGFTIVDIRLSILIGLTAGFLNLIPNFGTLVALIPAVLLAAGRALEEGGDPMLRIGGVLIVFIVVQLIQEIVLVPNIMGKRTGLRPATLLFSVFVWGKLLGFLGIILAIPLTCLVKVYFIRIVLKNDPELIEN